MGSRLIFGMGWQISLGSIFYDQKRIEFQPKLFRNMIHLKQLTCANAWTTLPCTPDREAKGWPWVCLSRSLWSPRSTEINATKWQPYQMNTVFARWFYRIIQYYSGQYFHSLRRSSVGNAQVWSLLMKYFSLIQVEQKKHNDNLISTYHKKSSSDLI